MSFRACAVASGANLPGQYLAKLILQRLAECSDENGHADYDMDDLATYSGAAHQEIVAAVTLLITAGVVRMEKSVDTIALQIVGGAELEAVQ